MKAIALTVGAFVAGALAQQGRSQTVANPPDHSNPGPGKYRWTALTLKHVIPEKDVYH